ncbi:dihydroorotate dehydrogenase electron transfer subunit [Chloroflexota bacterium]
MNQSLAVVISNEEVMPNVYLTWLRSPQIAREASPGQFLMVRCGEDAEFPLRRPLSVHRSDGDRLAFLFMVVGKGTEWLAQRRTGDSLDLLGTLGNGFSIQPASRKLLLLSGGMGIAPLCFLAQQSIEQGLKATLVLAAATAGQICPSHLLPHPTDTIVCTEDGTAGDKGLITDIFPDFVGEADQIFACGPMPMYKAMTAQKQLFRGKSVQVSMEMRMGCGLGVCYGCTVKTGNGLKQVCQDGPVFELDEILWDELDCL